MYLIPPKERKKPGKIWRLLRCAYGLNDASRYWYLKVKEVLIKLGCKCSKLDAAVFLYHNNDNELLGLLLSHVDDFLWSGSLCFITKVISPLKSTFKISSESSSCFKYIGIDLNQLKDGICLNQLTYIEELKEIEVQESHLGQPELPLNKEEKTKLRSLIGQLTWISTQSRPDIAFGVSILASNFKDAKVNDLMRANKIIKYLKMKKIEMYFPKLNLENLKVRCFADASYGNLVDGGSQMGMFIELVSDENSSSPIIWHSKRISRVVRSVMAAETLSMVEAYDNAKSLSELLSEVLFNSTKKIPIEGLTDSRQLYESAYSKKKIQDRRLRIDLAMIREAIKREEFILNWVPAAHQLSDCLTKDGADSSSILKHINHVDNN